MITKYDRLQISYINTAYAERAGGRTDTRDVRKMAVPERETFEQIFEKAKKGNEMAAVLLDDWQRNCEPKDDRDKQVVQMINIAAKRIFR